MKLVIDINEELYEQAVRDKAYHDVTGLNDINDYSLTIAQGIPYEERPQGEWEVIWHKDIYGRWSNYYEYKCSVCHNSYNDYSSGRKTAFCQFCGAKMKGGTE